MNKIVKEINDALKVFELPVFVSLKEIKKRYYHLSKKYHSDFYGKDDKMVEINRAYEILKEYIENYKFSFSEEEILKQFPQIHHADKFRF